MQKQYEGDQGSHQAADEIDEAGSDEVADALNVTHDAGDQSAAFVGIVVGN